MPQKDTELTATLAGLVERLDGGVMRAHLVIIVSTDPREHRSTRFAKHSNRKQDKISQQVEYSKEIEPAKIIGDSRKLLLECNTRNVIRAV